MSDEKLITMLGTLRSERMDRVADDKLRKRLEAAWGQRERRMTLAWRLRRPALALATIALAVGLGGATLRAGGDSPLYSVRITLENLAVPLHTDPEDRAEYLVWLLEERQAEAARLEATGNVLAAGRVRTIEQDTLKTVRAELPVAPETEQPPLPSPTPAPTEAPTPSPTPSPTPVPTVAPTARPTERPVATPTHTPTPVPTTTRPTPIVSPSPIAVVITGTVKNPDGTLASQACVTLSTAGPCLTKTTAQGTFKATVSAKIGQTTTLYIYRTDATTNVTYKAIVNVVIKSNSVDVGLVLLRQ